MSAPRTLPLNTRQRGNPPGQPARDERPAQAEAASAFRLPRLLRTAWSSSDFDGAALNRFAQPVMSGEAQQGVLVLGVLTMLLMSALALLYYALRLGTPYVYTFALLAALSGHTALSARVVGEIKVLYLLGMVLLAVCGLAFMLLAHRYGVFTSTLFSTVVVLFMVVPLVPWGLREALYATGIIYLIFTASTLSAARAFDVQTLWTLQFLMLTGAAIALTVVVRAVLIRKAHVEARFRLTVVNEELYGLSHRDSLTGAWNRRFLEEQFPGIAARYCAQRRDACFWLLDIDRFKQLNDTHGHPCGDRVLQHLVRTLGDALGADDYLVRMGGDEFALLLGDAAAGERVEHALRDFCRRSDAFPELAALPRVSIGRAALPAGAASSLEHCYLQADRALYLAKGDPAQRSGEVETPPEMP